MDMVAMAKHGSPFHEGERIVQGRAGVRDVEAWASKMIRRFMPAQHRAFYAALPFVVAAARDARGRPWVTLLAGGPGFIASPDDRTLHLGARPSLGDGLADAFVPGAAVGLLGLEFSSRRRNRVNGRVAANARADGSDTAIISFEVAQAFGNCPQYISERAWRWITPRPAEPASPASALTSAQHAWIERADTFFIGSGIDGDAHDPAVGMDASHRGGPAGFVQITSDTELVFPDYAGNNHFNTIGNLVMDPRVALTFVDFAEGSLLQLTGRAEIVWDEAQLAHHPGARRLVRVSIEEVRELAGVLPLRWEPLLDQVKPLRVIERVQESDDVVSFHLAPDDGAIDAHQPGQYLPLGVLVDGANGPTQRTYSLSGPGAHGVYRISVKRASRGVVSRYLHDRVHVGDVLFGGAPSGDFVLRPGRPAVLISAGIGATPMVSMLHAIAQESSRRAWFIHGARDGRHHPFADEVQDLVASRPQLEAHVMYSHPRPDDTRHDGHGRVTGALVKKIVGEVDADYYLCGPSGFMQSLQGDLEALGVVPERIHAESFGPAAGGG